MLCCQCCDVRCRGGWCRSWCGRREVGCGWMQVVMSVTVVVRVFEMKCWDVEESWPVVCNVSGIGIVPGQEIKIPLRFSESRVAFEVDFVNPQFLTLVFVSVSTKPLHILDELVTWIAVEIGTELAVPNSTLCAVFTAWSAFGETTPLAGNTTSTPTCTGEPVCSRTNLKTSMTIFSLFFLASHRR